MKALNLILITVLFLSTIVLFAGEPSVSLKTAPVKTIIISSYPSLTPTTPKEAGFSEISIEGLGINPIIIPVTPRTASFDEYMLNSLSGNENETLKSLAPTTPLEADFSEN